MRRTRSRRGSAKPSRQGFGGLTAGYAIGQAVRGGTTRFAASAREPVSNPNRRSRRGLGSPVTRWRIHGAAASAALTFSTIHPEQPRCRRPRRAEARNRANCPALCRNRTTKAQRTFAKTHDSAADQYGEGERAYRVAYDALKHSYEKVGDHWEAKDEKGPSDERARSGGPNATGETAEGVDANASKKHLAEVARRLDITGRSKMSKSELVTAIEKANRRESPATASGVSRWRAAPAAARPGPRHLRKRPPAASAPARLSSGVASCDG